jgi:quinolinate synthase
MRRRELYNNLVRVTSHQIRLQSYMQQDAERALLRMLNLLKVTKVW